MVEDKPSLPLPFAGEGRGEGNDSPEIPPPNLTPQEEGGTRTPAIWVLLDDRAGNNAQSRGLALKLGIPFEAIQIYYSSLVSLPNFIRGRSLLGVDKRKTIDLIGDGELPDMVIAAGRRLTPISLYIKKHKPDCKLIHIMRPSADMDKFHKIILPEHDSSEPIIQNNIITSKGALHGITEQALQEAEFQWSPHLIDTPKPITTLLLGGNSKAGKMHADDIGKLADIIIPIVEKEKGSLLVTTSRRTPENCIEKLRNSISSLPHKIHLYGKGGANPYLAYLAMSERIIVTGDSVSMCSEAAFTSKPVYVFKHNAMTDKHHRYINSLEQGGYIKDLKEYSPGWTGGNKLDETTRIAGMI